MVPKALSRAGWRRQVVRLLLIAFSTFPAAAEVPKALEVAQQLVEAFNRHDPEAMAALVANDFELYYVGDDGKASLALTGPEALEKEMTGYFEAVPNVESKITDQVRGEAFVSFREQIVGGASSLAVYEVREGKIRRVWYYPAEP
ncbi:MAG: nuclear transport factor 2 family protein [Acidobacteriota bacterium]